jgi:hypothetical protein
MNSVTQLYPQGLGSLFVASYDSQGYGGGIRTRLHRSNSTHLFPESESLYDRQFTANQFVLATNPLRLTTNNFTFELNTCGSSPYVTSSLTRRWVCRLQLLLVLVSAVILKSEFRGTHEHILLSQIRDSPNLEGQVNVFISPEQGGTVISPGSGFLFRRLLRLARLRWRYSTPPPHGIFISGIRVRVTLRLAVYRKSVRLGDKPLETHDQLVLYFLIFMFLDSRWESKRFWTER